MLSIEVRSGPSAGTERSFESDLVRIGRSDDCDVVVPAHHVSGNHASIVFAAAGYVLRDHHSTNGTRVKRGAETVDLATMPGRECVLASGDVIELGEVPEDEDGPPVALHVRFDEGESEEEATRFVAVRDARNLDAVEAKAALDRELLRKLYSAQKAISTATEIDAVTDTVAEVVFSFLPRATHITAALIEDDAASRKSARYVPVGSRVRDGAGEGDAIPVTRSVFKKVVKERAAVLAADAKRDVGESASLMAAQILSTIGVPLWQGDDIIGVLQVDNRASTGVFKERDLDVLLLVAQSASQAFVRSRMWARLRAAEERQREENDYLKGREAARRIGNVGAKGSEPKNGGILGESPAMERLFDQLRKVVDTRVTVLIHGETGTGKELVASAAHYWSQRRDGLFVAQNCAAVPENLLESELFGHKKGAFTGATDDKKGLFELAHEGTLFLDEVGEMPLALQAKLLRVLQEGEIRPVGSGQTKRVDTRIVAATNRDLEVEVKEGRFRQDLFYRLQVFPLSIPPLRDRGEDVVLLANHFLERYRKEFGRTVSGFSQVAVDHLRAYAWPGNVRELENEVQRLIIQMDEGEDIVMPQHLSTRISNVAPRGAVVRPTTGSLKEMMEQIEISILREALDDHDNNKSATAKTLGITREGLHKKLKKYGLA